MYHCINFLTALGYLVLVVYIDASFKKLKKIILTKSIFIPTVRL